MRPSPWMLTWLAAGGLALAAAALGWALHRGAWPGLGLERLRPGPDAQPVYKTIDGHALRLHVFRARGPRPGAQAPLLVFAHGGGWVLGDARQFYPQCRHFARLGLDCVSVEYRVRSRHASTPADAVQDLRDAVRHLRRHGAALGVRLPRLVLGGGSAGGHLAAAVAAPLPLPDPGAEPQAPVRPDALLLYNPMLDLSPGLPDHDLVADDWQRLSPYHHLGAATPPALLLAGDADPEVSPATLQRVADRLRQHGVAAHTVVYPGATHGFFNPRGLRATHFHATNAEVWRFLAEQGWVPAAMR